MQVAKDLTYLYNHQEYMWQGISELPMANTTTSNNSSIWSVHALKPSSGFTSTNGYNYSNSEFSTSSKCILFPITYRIGNIQKVIKHFK